MKKIKIIAIGIIISLICLTIFMTPAYKTNISASKNIDNQDIQIKGKFGPFPCGLYCFCKNFIKFYFDLPSLLQILLRPIGQLITYLEGYVIYELAEKNNVNVYTDCECDLNNCIICAN